jgi:hypothetical protein
LKPERRTSFFSKEVEVLEGEAVVGAYPLAWDERGE